MDRIHKTCSTKGKANGRMYMVRDGTYQKTKYFSCWRHMARYVDAYVRCTARKKAKQRWAIEKPELDNAKTVERNTGCFATLGPYVDTGANLGKQEVGGEIFISRTCFASLGISGLTPDVYFSLLFLWLWLRIEVALIPSLGRQSFGGGLKSWFLLSLVSPNWGLFLQIGVSPAKKTLFLSLRRVWKLSFFKVLHGNCKLESLSILVSHHPSTTDNMRKRPTKRRKNEETNEKTWRSEFAPQHFPSFSPLDLQSVLEPRASRGHASLKPLHVLPSDTTCHCWATFRFAAACSHPGMKAARRKLDIPMPAAVPCKIPIKSSGETHRNIGKRKTKYACVVDADEKHETKAGRSWDTNFIKITSLRKGWIPRLTTVSFANSFRCLKQMKIPDAKAAVEKMGKTGENSGMAVDERSETRKNDRWSKEWGQKSTSCVVNGRLSSQEFGVGTSVSKVQRKGSYSEVTLSKMFLVRMQYSLNKDHQSPKWQPQKSWTWNPDFQDVQVKQQMQYPLIRRSKRKVHQH